MGETHPFFLGWTSWHDRLHRRLLMQPQLLPQDSSLLLAVSGGQDSMALLALLQDLAPLHGWDLQDNKRERDDKFCTCMVRRLPCRLH